MIGDWVQIDGSFEQVTFIDHDDGADVLAITEKMLEELSGRFSKQGIKLVVSDEASECLAAGGYDRRSGVRPLRRLIQHSIEDAAAELLLSGKAAKGDTVKAETEGGKIVLRVV